MFLEKRLICKEELNFRSYELGTCGPQRLQDSSQKPGNWEIILPGYKVLC